MATVSPTQSAIDTVLRAFLLNILPAGVEVIAGQDNRVPEPVGADFVVMTNAWRTRFSTNYDTSADVFFTGAIVGGTLTVTAWQYGAISIGAVLFGTGVTVGSRITSLGTGSGSTGTYGVAPAQTAVSQPIAAGAIQAEQRNEITFQLDVHGPGSADNAEIISTLLRDQYAWYFMQALDPAIAPLHADDPRQMPFVNGEGQYETRWVVEARLQANQVVGVPQQYADVIVVVPESVDVEFPSP